MEDHFEELLCAVLMVKSTYDNGFRAIFRFIIIYICRLPLYLDPLLWNKLIDLFQIQD